MTRRSALPTSNTPLMRVRELESTPCSNTRPRSPGEHATSVKHPSSHLIEPSAQIVATHCVIHVHDYLPRAKCLPPKVNPSWSRPCSVCIAKLDSACDGRAKGVIPCSWIPTGVANVDMSAATIATENHHEKHRNNTTRPSYKLSPTDSPHMGRVMPATISLVLPPRLVKATHIIISTRRNPQQSRFLHISPYRRSTSHLPDDSGTHHHHRTPIFF